MRCPFLGAIRDGGGLHLGESFAASSQMRSQWHGGPSVEAMNARPAAPKITVITPCLNSVRYVGGTGSRCRFSLFASPAQFDSTSRLNDSEPSSNSVYVPRPEIRPRSNSKITSHARTVLNRCATRIIV